MRTESNTERTKQKRDRGGMDECIENCLDCSRACLEAAPECLKMGGKHAASDHIALLFNCADICQTSAKFMISGSPLHTHTCRACAEISEACARECSAIGMDECAEVCRGCAESCRQMASH